MFLLDTDILIYSLKGHEAVIRSLEHHRRDPPQDMCDHAHGALLRGV